MKKFPLILAIPLLLLLLLFIFKLVTTAGVLTVIETSHYNAHLPSTEKFDALMQKAILDYFVISQDSPDSSQIGYEVLGEAKATGIAFPKFYIWLQISHERQVVREGAARVAIIDEDFEVTDFVSREEAREDREKLVRIFPHAVYEKIAARTQDD